MPDELTFVLVASGAAAIASVVGGLLALWHRASTVVTSLAFGFASGALLGSIAFEMLPAALRSAGLTTVIAGFCVGMLTLYAFDLLVHGGRIVGEHADQRRIIRRYRRRQEAGSEVTVLAGGTSIEELIEGLAIGVAAAVAPSVAIVVALAIAIDNLAEGMSVGELIRGETSGRRQALPRVLRWTGVIGLALFVSAVVGWFTLRDIAPELLGALLAGGAGAMLYLTLGSLVPAGETRQYQGSATLASGIAFVVILALATAGG